MRCNDCKEDTHVAVVDGKSWCSGCYDKHLNLPEPELPSVCQTTEIIEGSPDQGPAAPARPFTVALIVLMMTLATLSFFFLAAAFAIFNVLIFLFLSIFFLRAESRKKIMADMTICCNATCKSKEECYRFSGITPSEHQSFGQFGTDWCSRCDSFVPLSSPFLPTALFKLEFTYGECDDEDDEDDEGDEDDERNLTRDADKADGF